MAKEHPHSGSAIRPLSWAFAITSVFFIVELAGGWWTGSLALVADAMHMGVDLIALGLGLFAARLSLRPPDAKRTFGYKRVEVLAALGNGVGLMVATGIILREAYARYGAPRDILAGPMIAVSFVGLACNLLSGFLLYRSSRENINLRAVFLHVVSDALGSVAAIVAGVVILRTGWTPADPLASALICVGIIFTSFWLIRDSLHILLEGAPPHLDLDEVRAALRGLPGVCEVHDLHLWSLTRGSESLSAHIVLEKERDASQALKAGTELLERRFGLSHVTLQIENPKKNGDASCAH
jgi:cobalt-zinc-cadmium efflux system protein